MKSHLIVTFALPVAAAALLTACNRMTEDWPTRMGNSADAANYPNLAMQKPAGEGQSFPLTGCLSGSNSDFVITDQNTGTVYQVQGGEDFLKMHVGELVGVQGSRQGGQGVPIFKVDGEPQTVASMCPPQDAGAISELNRPPSEKRGLEQVEVPPPAGSGPGVMTPPGDTKVTKP